MITLQAHTAVSVRGLLAKTLTRLLLHPLYSPDLAHCDCLQFPRMKKFLKGKRFTDIPEVKRKSKNALEGIEKDEYEWCFQQLATRLNKVIIVNLEYFKGDQNKSKIKFCIFLFMYFGHFRVIPSYKVFFARAQFPKTGQGQKCDVKQFGNFYLILYFLN